MLLEKDQGVSMWDLTSEMDKWVSPALICTCITSSSASQGELWGL